MAMYIHTGVKLRKLSELSTLYRRPSYTRQREREGGSLLTLRRIMCRRYAFDVFLYIYIYRQ